MWVLGEEIVSQPTKVAVKVPVPDLEVGIRVKPVAKAVRAGRVAKAVRVAKAIRSKQTPET